MKPGLVKVTVLFCILAIGCQENVQKEPDDRLINSQLMKSYNDIAIQNAIVSQHTLFPYHFVTNGSELNELGQRDLAALTSHFIKHTGHLNIRRHDTSAALYEARINMVRERLVEAGIGMERISISDSMPGGSGITSERLLIILEQAPIRAATGTTTSISTGAR
jgi:hypothetical protein